MRTLDFESVARRGGLALAAALVFGAWRQSLGLAAMPLGVVTVGYTLLVTILLARRLRLPTSLPPPPPLRPQLLLAVASTALTLFLYRDALTAWYQADDLFFAVHFHHPQWRMVLAWWWPGRAADAQILRPISHLTTAAFLALFGPNPLPPHLLNIALHALTAILAGRIAWRLSGRPGPAVVTTIAVILQPLTVSTVCWIATHQDPLAAAFYLLSLAFLLEACAGRRWARAASVAAFALGLLCKESATSLPLPAIVLALLADPAARRPTGLARAVGPHVLLFGLYVFFRLMVFGGPGGYVVQGQRAPFLHLRPQALKAGLLQLPEVLLVPANQRIVAHTKILRPLAAALGVLAIAAMLGVPRDPRAIALTLLGGAITVASVGPVHNMIWLGPELLNARFLYIAALGFCLMVSGIVHGIATTGDHPKRRRALAAAVVGSLALWLGHLPLFLANRDQWLASASIPGGLAADLRALAHNNRIAAIELIDFPDFWCGSYVFNLDLVPRVAQVGDVQVVRRRSDSSMTPSLPPGDALCITYRFIGGERLWIRESAPRCSASDGKV